MKSCKKLRSYIWCELYVTLAVTFLYRDKNVFFFNYTGSIITNSANNPRQRPLVYDKTRFLVLKTKRKLQQLQPKQSLIISVEILHACCPQECLGNCVGNSFIFSESPDIKKVYQDVVSACVTILDLSIFNTRSLKLQN